MLDVIRRNAQSWIVKLIFAVIIIVFIFWGVTTLDTTPQTTIALVNDEQLTIMEFSDRYENRILQLTQGRGNLPPEMAPQVKQIVLQELITNKLLLQEARRLQLGATPEELLGFVSQDPAFQNDQGQFDKELYLQRFQEASQPVGKWENTVVEMLTLTRLQAYVMSTAFATPAESKDLYLFGGEQRNVEYALFDSQKFLAEITPSEDEVLTYYETNKEQFREPKRISVNYLLLSPETLAANIPVAEEAIKEYYDKNSREYFQQPERVKVSHIMVLVPESASQEERDAAQTEALKIYGEAQTGDFGALARKYSDDASAANGGEMGWVSRGEMIKEFEDAVFALKVGEISNPVLTPFGYHIIRADAREESRIRSLAEVHDEIKLTLAQDEASGKMQEALGVAGDRLLEGISIAEIGKELSLDVRTAENFSRQEARGVLGVQDSDLDILFAVPANTPVDRTLRVQSGYVLAEVTEVAPEHIAELKDVRERVVETLSSGEAQQKAVAAAEAALKAVESGNLPDNLVKTELFGRQGFIADLGQAPDLVTAAFDLKQRGDWGKQVFPVSNGAVIIRLADVQLPSESDWEQAKDTVLEQVQIQKAQDWFTAFAAGLFEHADIEEANMSLLDRIQ